MNVHCFIFQDNIFISIMCEPYSESGHNKTQTGKNNMSISQWSVQLSDEIVQQTKGNSILKGVTTTREEATSSVKAHRNSSTIMSESFDDIVPPDIITMSSETDSDVIDLEDYEMLLEEIFDLSSDSDVYIVDDAGVDNKEKENGNSQMPQTVKSHKYCSTRNVLATEDNTGLPTPLTMTTTTNTNTVLATSADTDSTQPKKTSMTSAKSVLPTITDTTQPTRTSTTTATIVLPTSTNTDSSQPKIIDTRSVLPGSAQVKTSPTETRCVFLTDDDTTSKQDYYIQNSNDNVSVMEKEIRIDGHHQCESEETAGIITEEINNHSFTSDETDCEVDTNGEFERTGQINNSYTFKYIKLETKEENIMGECFTCDKSISDVPDTLSQITQTILPVVPQSFNGSKDEVDINQPEILSRENISNSNNAFLNPSTDDSQAQLDDNQTATEYMYPQIQEGLHAITKQIHSHVQEDPHTMLEQVQINEKLPHTNMEEDPCNTTKYVQIEKELSQPHREEVQYTTTEHIQIEEDFPHHPCNSANQVHPRVGEISCITSEQDHSHVDEDPRSFASHRMHSSQRFVPYYHHIHMQNKYPTITLLLQASTSSSHGHGTVPTISPVAQSRSSIVASSIPLTCVPPMTQSRSSVLSSSVPFTLPSVPQMTQSRSSKSSSHDHGTVPNISPVLQSVSSIVASSIPLSSVPSITQSRSSKSSSHDHGTVHNISPVTQSVSSIVASSIPLSSVPSMTQSMSSKSSSHDHGTVHNISPVLQSGSSIVASSIPLSSVPSMIQSRSSKSSSHDHGTVHNISPVTQSAASVLSPILPLPHISVSPVTQSGASALSPYIALTLPFGSSVTQPGSSKLTSSIPLPSVPQTSKSSSSSLSSSMPFILPSVPPMTQSRTSALSSSIPLTLSSLSPVTQSVLSSSMSLPLPTITLTTQTGSSVVSPYVLLTHHAPNQLVYGERLIGLQNVAQPMLKDEHEAGFQMPQQSVHDGPDVTLHTVTQQRVNNELKTVVHLPQPRVHDPFVAPMHMPQPSVHEESEMARLHNMSQPGMHDDSEAGLHMSQPGVHDESEVGLHMSQPGIHDESEAGLHMSQPGMHDESEVAGLYNMSQPSVHEESGAGLHMPLPVVHEESRAGVYHMPCYRVKLRCLICNETFHNKTMLRKHAKMHSFKMVWRWFYQSLHIPDEMHANVQEDGGPYGSNDNHVNVRSNSDGSQYEPNNNEDNDTSNPDGSQYEPNDIEDNFMSNSDGSHYESNNNEDHVMSHSDGSQYEPNDIEDNVMSNSDGSQYVGNDDQGIGHYRPNNHQSHTNDTDQLKPSITESEAGETADEDDDDHHDGSQYISNEQSEDNFHFCDNEHHIEDQLKYCENDKKINNLDDETNTGEEDDGNADVSSQSCISLIPLKTTMIRTLLYNTSDNGDDDEHNCDDGNEDDASPNVFDTIIPHDPVITAMVSVIRKKHSIEEHKSDNPVNSAICPVVSKIENNDNAPEEEMYSCVSRDNGDMVKVTMNGVGIGHGSLFREDVCDLSSSVAYNKASAASVTSANNFDNSPEQQYETNRNRFKLFYMPKCHYKNTCS